MVMLDSTEKGRTSPCSLRSSGMKPRPASFASLGLRIFTC